MTEETSGCFYQEYRPSRRERFWRKMGFRFHLGDDPPDVPPLVGWMQNKSRFNFGWGDRLRLLLTGRLEVTHTFEFDTPSPDKIRTRLDWQIKAPGDLR
jgi:hypothetical protein